MRPKRIYPAGRVYRMGKYEIWLEPRTFEGGVSTKRIWMVWEGDIAIYGYPTLRDAVDSINQWLKDEARDAQA